MQIDRGEDCSVASSLQFVVEQSASMQDGLERAIQNPEPLPAEKPNDVDRWSYQEQADESPMSLNGGPDTECSSDVGGSHHQLETEAEKDHKYFGCDNLSKNRTCLDSPTDRSTDFDLSPDCSPTRRQMELSTHCEMHSGGIRSSKAAEKVQGTGESCPGVIREEKKAIRLFGVDMLIRKTSNGNHLVTAAEKQSLRKNSEITLVDPNQEQSFKVKAAAKATAGCSMDVDTRLTESNMMAATRSNWASGYDHGYECLFCFRRFASSQSLGGHQNAHKRERRQVDKVAQQQRRRAQYAGGFASSRELYSSNIQRPFGY